MTSPTTIGPEQHHLESRTVRDIVEYSPGQVNEVWCRKIFRQILQSLELQYAMHMPHRAITPDTVVFHENGEPLLVPSPPPDPDAAPREHLLRDDLTALAGIVHYAITHELFPSGPLRGRAPADYSDSLVTAVDRCMAPDPADRPATIEELRDILGIVVLGPPLPTRVGMPPVEGADALAADAVPRPAAAAPRDLPPQAPASASASASAPAAEADLAASMSFMREPGASRFGAGLGRWQRWAIAGGGGALLLALAITGFSELRDSGPFDHVVLALPQQDGGAQTAEGGQHAGESTAAGQGAPATAPGDVATAAAAQDTPAPPMDAASAPAVAAATPATEQPAAQAAGQPVAPAPAAPAPMPAPAPAAAGAVVGKAVYRLQIQPWGVLYVDGVDRGVSPPVKRLELAPGHHTLRITNPNFHDRVLEVDTVNGNGRIAIDFNSEAP